MSHTPVTPLPNIVTATYDRSEYSAYNGYTPVYKDYVLTFVSRGRTYRIGTLTEYPGDDGALLLHNALARTATEWKVWFKILRGLGYVAGDIGQPERVMFRYVPEA